MTSLTPTGPSPAEELATLDEVFSRDSLSLTREDRSLIIAYYTKQKANFDAAAAVSAKPKRVAQPKAKTPLPEMGSLLSDLL